MVAELPLLEGFRGGDAVGWHAGRPVDAAHFCGAAAAFAAALPRKRHVLNLCEDRLSFMLGFAAALIARQVSLLPFSRAPGALMDLYRAHSDIYCLADGSGIPPGLHAIMVPRFAHSREALEVPRVPGDQVALIAYTSGSTGEPQPHAQSWGSLVADARSLGRELGFAQGGLRSIVGTVPPQHIYGMETTVMLPLQNGMAVHSGRPLLPGDVASALRSVPGERWLVATPTHLRACVADGASMPPLAGILSATMPLPPELAREAEQRWSAPLHEIYGCTEGGALALRRPVRSEIWRVRDGMGLRRAGSATWVEGGHLARPLRIPDRVELLSDTQFRLLGRPEDMAKIAGKRASLEALTRELLSIPGVEDGMFFDPGAASAGTARLAAVVVAPQLEQGAILRVLRDRIDPAFLPRPLIVVPELPRTETGKVSRAQLLALLEAAQARNRDTA